MDGCDRAFGEERSEGAARVACGTFHFRLDLHAITATSPFGLVVRCQVCLASAGNKEGSGVVCVKRLPALPFC